MTQTVLENKVTELMLAMGIRLEQRRAVAERVGTRWQTHFD